MNSLSPRALYLLQALEVRFENLPSREDERQLSLGAQRIMADKRRRMRGWRRRIAASTKCAQASRAHLEKLHGARLDAVQHDQDAWDRAKRDHAALAEALGL